MNTAKPNYQRELDKMIERQQSEGRVPTLLLHSCCAPCSSYTLEYLSQFFSITLLYYNPNITPESEYQLRLEEQRRLISELEVMHPITLLADRYNPSEFLQIARGLEHEPEGGLRCMACYRLRLERAAQLAAEHGMDYFCTTLSISPLKRADKINAIGQELARQYGVAWLPSDFKKRGGYLRSIELSRQHNLYRQNFCGCGYSRMQSEQKEESSKNIIP